MVRCEAARPHAARPSPSRKLAGPVGSQQLAATHYSGRHPLLTEWDSSHTCLLREEKMAKGRMRRAAETAQSINPQRSRPGSDCLWGDPAGEATRRRKLEQHLGQPLQPAPRGRPRAQTCDACDCVLKSVPVPGKTVPGEDCPAFPRRRGPEIHRPV
jgi:hypothetical protein